MFREAPSVKYVHDPISRRIAGTERDTILLIAGACQPVASPATAIYKGYAAMSSPTIVVTEPEFRRAPEVFTSTPDATFVPVPHAEAELSDAVREHRARHVVLGPDAVHRPALRDAPAWRSARALRCGARRHRQGAGHQGGTLLHQHARRAAPVRGGAHDAARPGRRPSSDRSRRGHASRTLGATGGRRAPGQDARDRRMRHDRTGRGAHRIGRIRHANDRRPALGRRGKRRRRLSDDDGRLCRRRPRGRLRQPPHSCASGERPVHQP